jgi:hypothetical protein
MQILDPLEGVGDLISLTYIYSTACTLNDYKCAYRCNSQGSVDSLLSVRTGTSQLKKTILDIEL